MHSQLANVTQANIVITSNYYTNTYWIPKFYTKTRNWFKQAQNDCSLSVPNCISSGNGILCVSDFSTWLITNHVKHDQSLSCSHRHSVSGSRVTPLFISEQTRHIWHSSWKAMLRSWIWLFVWWHSTKLYNKFNPTKHERQKARSKQYVTRIIIRLGILEKTIYTQHIMSSGPDS
jgi:hypothetical protein